MNLGDFIVRATMAFKDTVFQKCSPFARTELGVFIAGGAYKIGKKAADGSLQKFGMIDKDGNLDLDFVNAAVGNGIEWPLKVELPLSGATLTFEKTDWESLLNTVRSGAK